MKREIQVVKPFNGDVAIGDIVKLSVTEDSRQRRVFDCAFTHPYSWEEVLPIAHLACPERNLKVNLEKGEEWIGKIKDMITPSQNPTVILRGTTFTKHCHIITNLKRLEKTTLHFDGYSLIRKIISGKRVISQESLPATERNQTFLYHDKIITTKEIVVGGRIAMRTIAGQTNIQIFIAGSRIKNVNDEILGKLYPAMSEGQYKSCGRLYQTWESLGVLVNEEFANNFEPIETPIAA